MNDLLNFRELSTRGWTAVDASAARIGLAQAVEQLAGTLGRPVPLRGRRLVQELRPTPSERAHPRSLSMLFGEGAFPLHIDTAHWPVPCRYVVMACASADGHAARTSLLPIGRLTLTRDEQSMLHTTVFRVRSGRHSFFATVASRERSFIRFDPGCMEPTCSSGPHVMSLLSSNRWASSLEEIDWEPGVIVVVDNWRVLHGRDAAAGIESESRTLLRVLVQ
ncbi:TauD/TfdA family dioxygenase [Roseateles sp. BYS78W]|uniref:TauD/TfdA family dioxygenase n=1 Tax=Pelomonas candidula TaxID=3299025 RepID=A0ABW7HEG0_9BURK